MTHITFCNHLQYFYNVSTLTQRWFENLHFHTSCEWNEHTVELLKHLHLSSILVTVKVDRHLSRTSQQRFHNAAHTLSSKYDDSDKMYRRNALPVDSGNGVIRQNLVCQPTLKKTWVDLLILVKKGLLLTVSHDLSLPSSLSHSPSPNHRMRSLRTTGSWGGQRVPRHLWKEIAPSQSTTLPYCVARCYLRSPSQPSWTGRSCCGVRDLGPGHWPAPGHLLFTEVNSNIPKRNYSDFFTHSYEGCFSPFDNKNCWAKKTFHTKALNCCEMLKSYMALLLLPYEPRRCLLFSLAGASQLFPQPASFKKETWGATAVEVCPWRTYVSWDATFF